MINGWIERQVDKYIILELRVNRKTKKIVIIGGDLDVFIIFRIKYLES